ncbi:hypothetical protein [Micromonospora tarensis]|uniref:PD-(D/E)XK nuclease superfamily protein n=1 Tax=Micromonospora tarensis TaxID=2806100 RepID=A0ABS1Y9P1_9ACTN|nr:hypothetical protein [Micromonospora tarensis]MBM0274115.1 hypothetical protein [Micromonospora tarensis]
MTAAVSDAELAALIADLRLPATPAAEPRCAVTELIAAQCAHCLPALASDAVGQPRTPSDKPLGPWITASYRGTCSSCGTRTEEMDDIRADGDGGWLGRCCGDVDEPATTPTLDGLIVPPSTLLDIAPGIEHAMANQPPQYALMIPMRDDGIRSWPATPEWDNEPHQVPAGPPPSTVEEMRQVLADLDGSRARSQQTRLGPSELGTPCQRQIAMKLAGVVRQPEDKRPPWAPMQGTAMHTLMEEALHFHNRQLGRDRWAVEETLTVDPGLPGVDPITGHGDAFDNDYATVVDWKYVGVTALRQVKRKKVPNTELVKPEYRIQAHLYGRGHERAGRKVRWVRLVFLARSHDYNDSAEWTEEYRPDIADWAVDRYFATHDLIGEHGLDLAANPDRWPAVPAVPGSACAWCPFKRPGPEADQTGCRGDLDQEAAYQMRGLIAWPNPTRINNPGRTQ